MKSAFDVAMLKEYLDDVDQNIIEMSTNFYEFITHLVERLEDAKTMEEALKIRIDELKERKDRFSKRQETLRSTIQKAMEIAGEEKVELPIATISFRSTPQSVVVLEEKDIPLDYFKVSYSLDKAKIKDELIAGNNVNGACLSNGGRTISVRVK